MRVFFIRNLQKKQWKIPSDILFVLGKSYVTQTILANANRAIAVAYCAAAKVAIGAVTFHETCTNGT
jgi:hypothetical protein